MPTLNEMHMVQPSDLCIEILVEHVVHIASCPANQTKRFKLEFWPGQFPSVLPNKET